MYLDKLDGRINTRFFDEKAATWRQEQAKLQARIHDLQTQAQSYEDAITSIEHTSTLCKEFAAQPTGEQRRLLRIIIGTATWKDGKFETTLKTPFQTLRVSNAATKRNDRGNSEAGNEMKNWLLR